MNKTTILFVASEDFLLDDNYDAQSVYKEMRKHGLHKMSTKSGFHIEIKEFNSVDEKFITFIRREMVDYNFAKSTNFYVVKP